MYIITDSICDRIIQKCLRWNLEWLQISWNHIYTYIYPHSYNIGDISWWDLLFEDSNFFTSTSDNDNAKIFWIFTQEEMNFYSLSELDNLSEEQKNILLDLKENPRFIFD